MLLPVTSSKLRFRMQISTFGIRNSELEVNNLSLSLLVLGVFADDAKHALTLDELALVADRLDRRPDLHFLPSNFWPEGRFVLLSLTLAAAGETPALLEAVGNPTAAQVIGREFHHNLVPGQNLDEIHAHFARDVSQDLESILQFYTEHTIRQGLDN